MVKRFRKPSAIHSSIVKSVSYVEICSSRDFDKLAPARAVNFGRFQRYTGLDEFGGRREFSVPLALSLLSKLNRSLQSLPPLYYR
jgi:hypothetical protein